MSISNFVEAKTSLFQFFRIFLGLFFYVPSFVLFKKKCSVSNNSPNEVRWSFFEVKSMGFCRWLVRWKWSLGHNIFLKPSQQNKSWTRRVWDFLWGLIPTVYGEQEKVGFEYFELHEIGKLESADLIPSFCFETPTWGVFKELINLI